ncbi:unnamed protein product (macronuclear) [Paramecium tetraurelia]|uniref:Uncharacterized protein n=1 Tax=Paramecium tetraurelia TaxID=5888 RepID=A0C5G5_PARTE|nr:uncharacterized protein GSPATT00006531001 [Paramecium tetraurelia]CAK66032.1 unnamed protein product [Paramecium tetraurelia]|eukprot:XP_001433429.1 hypothetical protein (macronuclear) [Paramecium tetraurelia strain d4-2]
MGCSISVEVKEQENALDTLSHERACESIQIQKYKLKKKYGRTREVSIILQEEKCKNLSNEITHLVPQLEIQANSILRSRKQPHEREIN